MSVNIAERPTFEKKSCSLCKRCVYKRDLSSYYIHFEARILNLIVSIKMVTVYQCESMIDLANKESLE